MVREDLDLVRYGAGAADGLLLRVDDDGARVGSREALLGAHHALRQELAEVSSPRHFGAWRGRDVG